MKKTIVLIACIIAGLCSQAQNCTPMLASDVPVYFNYTNTNLCPGQVAKITSRTIHPSVAGHNLDFVWFKGSTNGMIVQTYINNSTATTTATAFSDSYYVSATMPGLYTLLVRDHDYPTDQACWYTANITITANPNPSYTITGGGSFCSNISGASSAVSINLNGTAPFSLTWTDGTSITTKTGITSSPYVITPSGSGTYTVSAISDAYCVGVPTTNSAIVTRIQQPDVTWDVTKDSIYCAYANTTMLGVRINSPATATNGYSYKWMNVTNNIDMGNAASATLQAPTGTKVYGLTVSDVVNGTACVQALRNRVIAQNALPTYTVTGGGTFCSGATITPVTVTIGGGIQPYSLSYKDGAGVSHTYTVNGYNPISFALPERVDGTYQVISINDASPKACSTPIDASKIASIIVNSQPTITSLPTTPYCLGAVTNPIALSSLFSFSPSGGTATYTCSSAIAINGVSFIRNNIPGTYIVSATYNANGCASVGTNSIIINPLPTITANAGPTIVCKGNYSTLSAAGAYNYNWGSALGSGNSKTVTPSITTSYFVTGTDANGCMNTASVGVTVNGIPTVMVTASRSQICIGSATTIAAMGATNYSWNRPAGTVSPVTTTTYIVTGTDANGCINTASTTVTVNTLPTIAATATPTVICIGASSILYASSSNTGMSYIWNPQVGTVYPTSSTVYKVTGTDRNGCSNTASTTVTVNVLPTITTSAIPTIINIGSTATISVCGATSYLWSNSNTSLTQTVIPTNSTTYSVTGTDANGCKNIANTIVTVNQAPTITATAPIGRGTYASPYQIATINNLYWLSQNDSVWSSAFIQTADIDASSLASSVGFSPIGKNPGTMFTGIYDGQNHTITGLTINRPTTTEVGLFGDANRSKISNLGLIGVTITGGDQTAALVGNCSAYDSIANCYVTGRVTGTSSVGGLLGNVINSKIINCNSSCTVNGGTATGGLIGQNAYTQGNNTSVSTSYASGLVTGTDFVGGFIGRNQDATKITNCYAIGTVTGNSYVGGFVGSNEGAFGALTMTNCYATGLVSSSVTPNGGFIGGNTGTSTITNSFWNTETSGMNVGCGTIIKTISSLTGVTSAQMKTQSTFTNAGWDYKYETTNGTANNWVQYDYINSGFPSLTWQINYWNGTGNWNTASNWTPAYLPRANANIIIESGELTYNQNYTIQNACINAGAKLTVNSGLGFYTNNLLLVKSDATGTGSLIGYGKCNGNTIKVEQYLGGGRNWYIASPLTSANSSVIKTPLTNKLWKFNEPTGTWNEIIDATTSLSALTGYVAFVPRDTVITYGGGVASSLNLFYNSVSLTRSGITNQSGFNLIGNPYLSCVNWELVTKSNVEPSIWYRTKNMNNVYVFDSYNASSHVGTNNNGKGAVTKYIPPMQAVWVQVSPTAGTGQLSFDNSMLSHPVAGNTLKSDVTTTHIRLNVSNGKNSDETILVFNEQASNGYDHYDSEKMFGTSNDLPEIYTTVDSVKLVINGLKPLDSTNVVPLGFKTSKSGIFTITATEITGLENVPVILEDKHLHKMHDLSQRSTYTFASDSVNNANRFAIHLKSGNETTATTIETPSDINIYSKGNSAIVSTTADNANGTVTVFNILGQTIARAIITGTKTEIELPVGAAAYFVKVENEKNVVTKKIVVE